jgi:general stress protein 26
MVNYYKNLKRALFIFLLLHLPISLVAQEINTSLSRDSLLSAAREMMAATKYCTLITLDTTGSPSARTMDPFAPDENMVIWLGTNGNSKKVKEINKDAWVTLFYQAANGVGYVLIKGHATLIDDPQKKQTYWKKEWERFYAGQKEAYTLIKVVPDRLEIIDYSKGIFGDPKTWAAPSVEF